MQVIEQLKSQITDVMVRDQFWLRQKIQRFAQIDHEQKRQQVAAQIITRFERSFSQAQQRAQACPILDFPAQLPVVEKKALISQTIAEHQVVIIAGETGSGKTTQLPKICLELGRGIKGFIGHTQPRRLAARSVADRIAEEMESTLGEYVGFKVRFQEKIAPSNYIKLMTDGILLNEIQFDRYLNQYDTIIIDEAHERSLNIDFLLGYFKQLLPKRPDLKLIITSATIDPERFAEFFYGAPIVNVSGRTYPVETRYQPLLTDDQKEVDLLRGIATAIEELSQEGQGDILIFMNGEREIRDASDFLQKQQFPHTKILPLFARLNYDQQQQIFRPHKGRHIILATNVAETSLTVPGIRYVIDPGTARISRYSPRTKVQRLPIETISQASANQRSGRCGRVAAGICIRLYSEEDFLSRSQFTDPEVLRTNLAAVILQMLFLGLGDIKKFPFLEPPENRHIQDGVKLLLELQAITVQGSILSLTDLGKLIAKFPIDPKLARIVIYAAEHHVLTEVLVIVSALTIQDPRERPFEQQQQADSAHEEYQHPQSDFLSFYRLWEYIQQQQQQLSNSQFRKFCRQQFLSYIRIREWQDLHGQITQLCQDLGFSRNQEAADYQQLHQALLSGYFTQIALKEEKQRYQGVRQREVTLFPGSALSSSQPKWVMSAELVETSRLFARTNAKIQPLWLEPLIQHVVTRNYHDPYWNEKKGQVTAHENQTLYGLLIISRRRVDYGPINPEESRTLFIQQALVEQKIQRKFPFLKQNQQTIAEIQRIENKLRRRDLLIDEEQQYALYDAQLPDFVYSTANLERWWSKNKQKVNRLLSFTREQLSCHLDIAIHDNLYPNSWQQGHLQFPIDYHFEPSVEHDGVQVQIPLALLNQVQDTGFDWHIPGLRYELVLALIRGLPKVLRKNFVPAPHYAKTITNQLNPKEGPLLQQLSARLRKITGITIPVEQWALQNLPHHLRLNFVLTDEKGMAITQGEDLAALQTQYHDAAKQLINQKSTLPSIEREQIIDWDFSELPLEIKQQHAHYDVIVYPALIDHKYSVAIELQNQQTLAEQLSWQGIRRLILLTIPSPVQYLKTHLPNEAKLGMYYNPFGTVKSLIDDCIDAGCDQLIHDYPLPRTKQPFDVLRDHVRAHLNMTVEKIALEIEQVLASLFKVRQKLKGKIDLAQITALNDVKQQLDTLVFPGFVAKPRAYSFSDLNRYLQAILKRIEKLPIDPHKDKIKTQEIHQVEQAIHALQQGMSPTEQQHPNVLTLNKMVQELRVSFFAQNIGVSMSISSKRIYQAINAFT